MSANPPIDLLAIAEERVRDTEAAMSVRLFALEVGV